MLESVVVFDDVCWKVWLCLMTCVGKLGCVRWRVLESEVVFDDVCWKVRVCFAPMGLTKQTKSNSAVR